MTTQVYYGVYEVLKNGKHHYISGTVTTIHKLAQEIARDYEAGICIRPDGSAGKVRARKCVVKVVEEE